MFRRFQNKLTYYNNIEDLKEEKIMLMPSIFGENLFDDFFDDFARPARNAVRYSTPANNVMRTDIKENDAGFELDIDLPGYKKEDVKAELKDGYLTISAETRTVPAAEAFTWGRRLPRMRSGPDLRTAS